MDIKKEELERRYKVMSDEELVALHVRGMLTETASSVIEREFQQRGVSVPPNSNTSQIYPSEKKNLHGVKGWLRLYRDMTTFLWPLAIIANLGEFHRILVASGFSSSHNQPVFAIELVIRIGFIYASLKSGWLITKVRQDALSYTKSFLLACIIYNCIWSPLFYSAIYTWSVVYKYLLPSMLGAGFICIIWFQYFHVSSRVRQTLGGNQSDLASKVKTL